MKSYKNTEPIHLMKKVLSNRVNSVPSLKHKTQYMITNKPINPKNNNMVLIKRHILNDKKGLYNKNINRSAGNILQELQLKSIKESSTKNQIRKIKKINPLMNIDKNSSVILPEMKIGNMQKYKFNRNNNNDSLDLCFKTITNSKKSGIILNDEELILLLQAKCRDIGINFRENMFYKFKEFCNSKCRNRIADFAEFNFGINSIRVISLLLLDTNRLSRLDLSRNNIGNQGVEILVSSLTKSKSLVSLNLSSNSISHKGGQLIFESFVNQQSIVDLNLSSLEGSNRNRVTDVGIKNMPVFLNKNHFIEILNLAGNSIRNEGFQYICEGLENNQSLQQLDISNNGINEKGIKKGLEVISNNKIFCQINYLNLSYNNFSNAGILLFTSHLRFFQNLTALNIAYCGVEFKGFQSLLRTLQHMKRLDRLNVAGNMLNSDNFYILKESFAVFGVRYLNMSRCLLGDKCAFYLGECISSNESLKYLNISGNAISDIGFKGFMNIFKFNKTIVSFDCSCNFLTNNTVKEFVKSLYDNICLKSINFYDNQLNDDIGGDFISLIENNSHLIHINLSYNRIQTKTIEDINKKLKVNYEKSKNDIIPEIERSIRELEFRPEQFETLSKIIIEKQKMLKIAYKKLKEDGRNFIISMENANKKVKEKQTMLKQLIKEKKKIENELSEIYKRKKNDELCLKEKEDKKKNQIEEAQKKLFDIKKDNEDLTKKFEKKKKEINDKIAKVEKKCKLSLDRYNVAKSDYVNKEKEYTDKYDYYQKLLDSSLLQEIPKVEAKEENDTNKKTEAVKSPKIKLKLGGKKLNMKTSNQNNLYSTATLSTGNTGGNNNNINETEKRSFKFNKKK